MQKYERKSYQLQYYETAVHIPNGSNHQTKHRNIDRSLVYHKIFTMLPTAVGTAVGVDMIYMICIDLRQQHNVRYEI